MQVLSLTNIPNQSISARLDNVHTTIRVKQGRGTMLVDIYRDGVPVIIGQRILAGEPLIPYRYREFGNFILVTEDDDLPAWQSFGKTQKLIYLTVIELASYQNG